MGCENNYLENFKKMKPERKSFGFLNSLTKQISFVGIRVQ